MTTALAGPASPNTRHLGRILAAGAAVSLLGLTLTDGPAQATGFAVSTTVDGGAGSLRDAINQANANPGPDVITVPPGTYTLTIAGANEDNNATGDLDIKGDTVIVGSGGAAMTIINANGIDRVLDLQSGSTTLQGLTITNGNVGAFSGGNILEHQFVDLTVRDSVVSNGSANLGAGIAGDRGALLIERSEIINNTANFFSGSGAVGAAIAKTGSAFASLVVTDSLISGNNAVGGTAALYANANTNLTNTTITGNSSFTGTVLIETYGSNALVATLTHMTIAGNSTTGNVPTAGLSVNVIAPATMSLVVEGSLFQNNLVQGVPSNCSVSNLGVIASGGNNLTDDSSCTGFTQPSDLTNNQATSLGALADNGGPTRTMALIAGSSAIDAAGACSVTTATDQRGAGRPAGAACDIGAFEIGAVVPAGPTTSTSTTLTPTTTTMVATPTTTTTAGPTPTTTTVAGSPANPISPILVDNGALAPTTTGTLRRTLPVTGSSSAGGLWLAALACSLGGMLVLATRRIVR